MRRLVLASLLLIPASGICDPIDDFIKNSMDKDHIPGVCVSVIRPDGSADTRSYGLANLEWKTPYTPDTVHRIASVSKQFCAYAILNLAQEGKLSLEDNLLKYFPKGHKDWSKVTLRHVLAHRSGIADPGNDFSYRLDYSNDAYVEIIAKRPLAEEPGSTYRYNNHAYALLGLVVGIASGKPIEQYVKELVFDPLGMTRTSYYRMEDILENRSEGYRWIGGRYTRPLMVRPRIFHGSGGILSTMNDMLKYEWALREQKLISGEVLKGQWTGYEPGKTGYRAGWFVNQLKPLVVAHSGGTFGFTTFFQREVDAGWTVILFRNSEGGEVGDWAKEILRLAKQNSNNLHSAVRELFMSRH